MSLLSRKHPRIESPRKSRRIEKKARLVQDGYSELIVNVLSQLKLKCDHCMKSISPYSFIFLCASCKKDNMYCLSCFANREHAHDYVITPKVRDCCPFTDDWSVVDELQMLSFIEKNGVGNWLSLSESSLNKGLIDISAHFLSFYATENAFSISRKTAKHRRALDANQQRAEKMKLLNEREVLPDMSPVLQEKEKERSQTDLYQRFRFSLKRKEFEVEYLNDAEIELSGLEFNDYDDDITQENKHSVIRYYNSILDIRDQLKEILIENSSCGNNPFRSKMNKHEVKLIETFLPFITHLPKKDQKEIIEGMLMERKLRLRKNFLEKQLKGKSRPAQSNPILLIPSKRLKMKIKSKANKPSNNISAY